MNIIKFYDNDFSCFDENGKVNYTFLTIKGLTNPKYLTNITIFLTLIGFLFKSKKVTNILFPLLITNGVFISIYCLIFLEKFDIESLKYICPKEYKKPELHQKVLELTNTSSFISFYKYSQPFVHFWLPVLLYYLGYTKNKNKVTNVIESLIITTLLVSLYGLLFNSDRYGFVIDNKTIVRDYCIYLIIHFIITILYFYI